MTTERESSAPQINPYEFGRIVGEVRTDLAWIRERLAGLQCAAHEARMNKLSEEIKKPKPSNVWQWVAAHWRGVIMPLVLILLGTQTAKGCLTDEQSARIARAVQQLEARPPVVTKIDKVVLPAGPPVPVKPDAMQ